MVRNTGPTEQAIRDNLQKTLSCAAVVAAKGAATLLRITQPFDGSYKQ